MYIVVIEGDVFPTKELTPNIKSGVRDESLSVYAVTKLNNEETLFKLQSDLKTWSASPQAVF